MTYTVNVGGLQKTFTTRKAYTKYVRNTDKLDRRTKADILQANGDFEPTLGVGVTTSRATKNSHVKQRFAKG